jgi:hypothetical protein
VELDDLLAERQTDARAGIEVAAVKALEDEEHALDEARLDADPVVGDRERPLVAYSVRLDADDRGCITVELDSIANEILDKGREQ